VLRVVTAVAVLLGAAAARVAAQVGGADVVHRGLVHGGARPPAGFYQMLAAHPGAFEFKRGWLERARRVRLNRRALRAGGAWRQLNAPAAMAGPAGSATAVGGTLRYPTFLPLFKNTTAGDSALMDPAAIGSEFWGTTPAPPYSIATYYQEISGGRLTVTGTVIPPIRVSQPDSFYSKGVNCQGLCGASGVPDLIYELLQHADSTVNFATFADSTDGHVPAIVILDPQVGAECYLLYAPAISNIWAHRFALTGWGRAPYVTQDSINGLPVTIDDYIIQGGQGGGATAAQPGCSPGLLAPIGTVTHETGHLFGLPDLYDTFGTTEGLGRWDLMASGSEQKPWRPSHMSAWSLATLGWISEVPVTTPGTVVASPIERGDTAYVLSIAATPHNEYFLLENRQPIGSDSMMYGPGLMIYHVDDTLMAQRLFSNAVNAVVPHALAIEEAAGDTGLNCTYPSACNDRGDAGDPFPGTSGNTTFGAGTSPAANSNAGVFGGAIVDSIRQVTPFGAMRFRVSFGGVTTVWASDTNAAVQVDAATSKVFRGVLANGSSHTIGIDSLQTSADGKTQFRFNSWSDGLARVHAVTGSLAGATYTAAVLRRFLFSILVLGPGSISSTRPIDPANGSFLAEGDSVTLTPVPAAGSSFAGWSVDTITGSGVLALRVVRPYRLVATFAGASDVVAQLLTGQSGLTGGQLLVLDAFGNNNGAFDVGDFVAWLDRNPGVLSGAVVSRILRRAQR
jgi:M6 family metalloprotease-like protein